MKNKMISQSRREVKIYEDYYKPSFNMGLFLRSIAGVLIFGRTSVASTVPIKRRMK